MNKATLRDVAARANVSVGTASNVLNKPWLVAESTRRRVEKAVDELGFVRDLAARQLRAGRSYTIGVVVFDLLNPLFASIARSIEEFVSERNYSVILCDAAGSVSRLRHQLRLLEAQRVAGIVYSALQHREPTEAVRLKGAGLAMVRWGAVGPRRDRCAVGTDQELGARLAAEHLLELGHMRIGTICGAARLLPYRQRRTAFRSALEAAGVTPDVEIEVPSVTIADGARATRQLIEQAQLPTALFCHSDLLALGAMRELVALGIDVPDDVALVGFEDIPFAESALVPLTSVRIQATRVAEIAAGLLLDEIENAGHEHQRILVPPTLVVRQSTAPDR